MLKPIPSNAPNNLTYRVVRPPQINRNDTKLRTLANTLGALINNHGVDTINEKRDDTRKEYKTQIIRFRVSNEAYAKILDALNSPRNADVSVGDYCKHVIERHVFRHSTRKYRRG